MEVPLGCAARCRSYGQFVSLWDSSDCDLNFANQMLRPVRPIVVEQQRVSSLVPEPTCQSKHLNYPVFNSRELLTQT